MIAIPKNVSAISKLAGEAGPTGQILMVEYDNGMYRLVVTDGHQLAIVQGETLPWPHTSPQMPEGCSEYPIPIDLWRSTWSCLGKQEKTILLASDGDCLSSLHPGGFIVRKKGLAEAPKFPDYKAILPRAAPRLSVQVNPERLIALLQVFNSLTTGSWKKGDPRITLSVSGPNKPLMLTGKNQTTEQTFDALLTEIS